MDTEQFRRPLLEMNEDRFDEDGGQGSKRLSVERIYQKKTQLEHILLRPDTYVGSIEEVTQKMWVYDESADAIVNRSITYVPGLYKIFDEILVNAADNKQRDPKMNAIKITIKPEENLIKVWNNGKGIPVEMHREEKMYVPALIFGQLLTSSNYDDDQKKVTGGRNGYGAKLCNIFSSEFTIETSCKESGRMFKQTWHNNMAKSDKEVIKTSKDDYTVVTFKPDLERFKMAELDKDTVSLLTRRAYDIAGCTKGVKVYLNGKRLPVNNFQEYVQLYLKVNHADEDEGLGPRKVLHEVVNPRWEVCVTLSSMGFQQASFVNGIATTKGGTHIKHVVDPLVNKLSEVILKKNKGGAEVKPFQIKNHLWVFINCLIENPAFDSQTKENMTLKEKSFGSKCALSDKFIKSVLSCGVVESILQWAKVKSQTQLQKASGSSSKRTRMSGVPKLEDANDAGSKNGSDCTLILTEGDSAKALAVSGFGVVGRDRYGVFPLRGKLLNVREASHKQVMNNEEILNVVKIMGLKYGQKYDDEKSLKTLRYGHLMIMTDQDQDGSHIKGLVINFIHHNWPTLIRSTVMEEFITPIVKVSKAKDEKSFYSLPELEVWKASTPNHHTWKVKYYKGLGTSTSKEAKEYFSDMAKHRIPFRYDGIEDDKSIELAFSKKCIQDRKDWLTNWLQQRKDRKSQGIDESFLYGEQTDSISYTEFVNKELILFSNMDNERSIPNLVDGLKPGQRKVIFTCFKRNDKKDIKVAQLAGSVAEFSAYHHGEQSLMGTIVNLAQNYVGSNNVNLLQPIGQFGTRLNGGKDCASPRYIFTMLSPLTRIMFNDVDMNLLHFLYDDNQRIEPEWYCPVIPMILVNGSEGIGTGYSTFIPNYNPREIVSNLKRLINGLEPTDMSPWYKSFTGTIVQLEPHRYMAYGTVGRLSPTTLEITELPIRTWTQSYKESVLEPMLLGTEKTPAFISDYKEYHTDTTVKFVVTLSEQKMKEAEDFGIYKKFKLESSINTSNMVLFDNNMCLKHYDSPAEILKVFYDVRLELYQKRMSWLEGQLNAEARKVSFQAQYIQEVIKGTLVFGKKTRKQAIALLKEHGYPSDPVKAWKAKISAEEQLTETAEEDEEGASDGGNDYNYLMGLNMWNLTDEKVEELLKDRDRKVEELRVLKGKTHKDLWLEDLDLLLQQLEAEELKEKEEAAASQSIVKKSGKQQKGHRQTKLTSSASAQKSSTLPSAYAEVIEPKIPAYQETSLKAKRAAKKVADDKGAKPKGEVRKRKTEAPDETEPKKPAINEGPKKIQKKLTTFFVDDSSDESDSDIEMFDSDSPSESVPKKPQPSRARVTEPAIDIKGSDEEDNDDIEEDVQMDPPIKVVTKAPPKGRVVAKATKPAAAGTKEKHADMEVDPPPKVKPVNRTGKKIFKLDTVSSEEDSSADDAPPKAATKKALPAAKKTVKLAPKLTKPAAEKKEPKLVAANKPQQSRKPKTARFADSSSTENEDDDIVEMDDTPPEKKKARQSRAVVKAVKYTESSDESDDDGDDWMH